MYVIAWGGRDQNLEDRTGLMTAFRLLIAFLCCFKREDGIFLE